MRTSDRAQSGNHAAAIAGEKERADSEKLLAQQAAAAMEAERARVEKAAQRARQRTGRGRRLWLAAGIAAAFAVAAGLFVGVDGRREIHTAIPASAGKLELRLDRDAQAFAARAMKGRRQ